MNTNYLDIFPLELGFNLILLEKGIRKIYYVDIKPTQKILNSIPDKFSVLYYQVKQDASKYIGVPITQNDYFTLKKSVSLIITLKKNTTKIKKILENNDIRNKEFGELQSLICATDFINLYNDKNKRHTLFQARYMITYKNKTKPFMYQMCHYNQEIDTRIKNDIAKYQLIAESLGAKVSIKYGMRSIATGPKFISTSIWFWIHLVIRLF